MFMKTLTTDQAPAAIGPYAQAVQTGAWVFCSGQLGIDPATGKLVDNTVEPQTRQALKNLRAVLRAGGPDLSDVVKTTVFVADMNDFPQVNQVYAEAFGHHKPARATVQVARLSLDALVEAECIAIQE
jgi:2-iminobutanoate/2-iminopropanoate deaminase